MDCCAVEGWGVVGGAGAVMQGSSMARAGVMGEAGQAAGRCSTAPTSRAAAAVPPPAMTAAASSGSLPAAAVHSPYLLFLKPPHVTQTAWSPSSDIENSHR